MTLPLSAPLRARHRSLRLDARPRGALPARRRRVPVEPGGPVRRRPTGRAYERPALPPAAAVGHARRVGPASPRPRATGPSPARCRRSWRSPTATSWPSDATPWLIERLQALLRPAGPSGLPSPSTCTSSPAGPAPGFLHAAFPDARFVERDPRRPGRGQLVAPDGLVARLPGPRALALRPAVARARTRSTSAAAGRYVVLAGLAWVILMDAFEAAKAELPERSWLDVRYEDLLADARRSPSGASSTSSTSTSTRRLPRSPGAATRSPPAAAARLRARPRPGVAEGAGGRPSARRCERYGYS